jgi:hypothetical protein
MLDRYVGIASLVIGIIALVAPYRWPTIPPLFTTIGVGVAILLLGAAIGMFYSENVARDTSARRPELHLAVSGGGIFIPDGDPSLTGINLNARVWNTGAPSIVTAWSLRVIPNGQAGVSAQLTTMPNVLSASGPVNSARILGADSLEVKAAGSPVGITPVSGSLLFYVRLPMKVVKDGGTIFEIVARDIYEKETVVVQLIGDWLQR